MPSKRPGPKPGAKIKPLSDRDKFVAGKKSRGVDGEWKLIKGVWTIIKGK